MRRAARPVRDPGSGSPARADLARTDVVGRYYCGPGLEGPYPPRRRLSARPPPTAGVPASMLPQSPPPERLPGARARRGRPALVADGSEFVGPRCRRPALPALVFGGFHRHPMAVVPPPPPPPPFHSPFSPQRRDLEAPLCSRHRLRSQRCPHPVATPAIFHHHITAAATTTASAGSPGMSSRSQCSCVIPFGASGTFSCVTATGSSPRLLRMSENSCVSN